MSLIAQAVDFINTNKEAHEEFIRERVSGCSSDYVRKGYSRYRYLLKYSLKRGDPAAGFWYGRVVRVLRGY